MKKTPYLYNSIQSEEIQAFISNNFGKDCGYIAHEIKSEYVHTDTMLIAPQNTDRTFVTFGMGARNMNTPNNAKRCELVMCATKNIATQSKESFIISGELARISKFPFREDTWLGTGHTMDASEEFKEAFGYDFFAFKKLSLSAKLTGIDEDIDFLLLVPIYAEEREWCVNNHTLAFLDRLNEKYDGTEFNADVQREILLPEDIDEDEIDDYNFMTVLGIDAPTFNKLCEYIVTANDKGIEITNETINNWIKSNK